MIQGRATVTTCRYVRLRRDVRTVVKVRVLRVTDVDVARRVADVTCLCLQLEAAVEVLGAVLPVRARLRLGRSEPLPLPVVSMATLLPEDAPRELQG